MKKTVLRPLILLSACVILIFIFMAVAGGIQSHSGQTEIQILTIDSNETGSITAKLYRPKTATAASPAPAALLLHGYQNDKDTSSALALELSRRGYVVLAVDEFGHGSTSVGMTKRGYVNHRVTVNYGEDSREDGTFVDISGTVRYRIMLNFSDLTFFDKHYSADDAGNSIKDSSMGGVTAYAALGGFDFVDETRMVVGGHSMGTWASWSVAAAYSGAINAAGADISPKAVILQCGELFTDRVYDSDAIRFNNVLLLQAKYDEFSNFRDYKNTVADDLPTSSLRSSFLGVSPTEADWNTTYGSFAEGTARRMELLYTNHRLVTHNHRGIATALDWISQSIGGWKSDLDDTSHAFHNKELLTFLSLMLSLASMVFFMELLVNTPLFASVRQKPGLLKEQDGKGWWKGAWITILIAGLTYPFMTQLGHALLPLPENIFRMTIGNGFLGWYLLLILVMLFTTVQPWKKAKKAGKPLDYSDLGFAHADRANRFDWSLLAKSALLTAAMIGLAYLLVFICTSLFMLDFRLIWPFLKPFSLARFLQFFVYIPFFALFFLLNNSKILAQMHYPGKGTQGFKGFLSCLWRNAFCMAGGVFLVCLIEYIPFFLGIGPGADLLFSPTFGGPFMSLLLVFFPQILVLSVLCTVIQRRTGHVFVSGLVAACLSCWIITGGSAML